MAIIEHLNSPDAAFNSPPDVSFAAPKEDYCPGKVSGLEQYMSMNCQKRCCLQAGAENSDPKVAPFATV